MSERGEQVGMTEPGEPGTVNGKPEVAALRESIEQTRAELGRTVEALAAKVDVKARLREGAEQRAERVKESVRQRPVPWVAIATAAAALLVVFVIVRRRREWPDEQAGL